MTNQRVALPGMRGPAALGAVAVGRRDLQQHPAADLDPGEADGPPLDQAAQRRGQRRLGVALVEGGLRLVDLAEVVHRHGVGRLHGRARCPP